MRRAILKHNYGRPQPEQRVFCASQHLCNAANASQFNPADARPPTATVKGSMRRAAGALAACLYLHDGPSLKPPSPTVDALETCCVPRLSSHVPVPQGWSLEQRGNMNLALTTVARGCVPSARRLVMIFY